MLSGSQSSPAPDEPPQAGILQRLPDDPRSEQKRARGSQGRGDDIGRPPALVTLRLSWLEPWKASVLGEPSGMLSQHWCNFGASMGERKVTEQLSTLTVLVGT